MSTKTSKADWSPSSSAPRRPEMSATAKLAELGLDQGDIVDAVAWARQGEDGQNQPKR